MSVTLWALDEADDYEMSYEIVLGEAYTGSSPHNPSTDIYDGYSGSYISDWDDYIIATIGWRHFDRNCRI